MSLRLSPFDRLVLDAIERHGPISGSEILDYVNERWNGWFGAGASISRLYPALIRLEETDLIRGEFLPGPYPRTRVYRVKYMAYPSTE